MTWFIGGARRGGAQSALGGLLVLLMLIGAVGATEATRVADMDWELKVCADPVSLPFSSRDEQGFENRIAEILADELHAVVSYDWHIFNPDLVNLRLRQGECDLIMGVPDGFSDLLTTVAYYRSPYVFLYRSDAGFDLESLDDPILRTLEIGLQNAGIPPHNALINRGITENVSSTYGRRAGSPDRLNDLVVAVAEGEVDVGIVWGPVGAYFAREQPVELTIVPVTPEFEPPTTFMSVPMTIAVRPGDEALRDRLNVAIARRWDDIQDVLADYGVPVVPSPPPLAAPDPEGDDGVLRIGVVLPTRTGLRSVSSAVYEVVGEAARMGSLLAEGHLTGRFAGDGPALKLFFASAPTTDAAERAARRLVVTDKVNALIGGVGAGQARVMAEAAEAYGVPFLNVGSPEIGLRQEGHGHVFHVEASADMYIQALVDWYAGKGHRRWFIVAEDTEEGRRMLASAERHIQVRGDGGEIVGAALVEVEQPTYMNELWAAQDEGADVILLLMNAVDQMAFFGQRNAVGHTVEVAAYPDPVAQTRDYFGSAQERYRAKSSVERILLWEMTWDDEAATDLSEGYIGRFGKPMDPSAWAAYEAVRILHDAAARTGTTRPEALSSFMRDDANAFDVHKGRPLRFDPETGQLAQPLFVTELSSDAQWGINVWSQVDFAKFLHMLPAEDGVYEDGR